MHRIPNRDGSSVSYALYLLADDAEESVNVAPEMPQRVTRMKAELAAWQRSVADSLAGQDYQQP